MPSTKYEFIVNGLLYHTCYSGIESVKVSDLLDWQDIKFELVITELH